MNNTCHGFWKVCFCERSDVPEEIKNAHVAVPFMSKLDKRVLEHATALQLIIQYGVGLEGVDSSQVDIHSLSKFLCKELFQYLVGGVCYYRMFTTGALLLLYRLSHKALALPESQAMEQEMQCHVLNMPCT